MNPNQSPFNAHPSLSSSAGPSRFTQADLQHPHGDADLQSHVSGASSSSSSHGYYVNPMASGSAESLDTLYTITQSTYGAPVPPARTSSLAMRGKQSQSSMDAGNLPSVQVTHPTPTKSRRLRRRTATAVGLESEIETLEAQAAAWSEDSPTRRSGAQIDTSAVGQQRPSSSGPGYGGEGMNLASMNPHERGRIRPDDDDGEEDEDEDEGPSETDRRKAVEEARRVRAREKGRERQRRKRERDKKAKETARLTGTSVPPTGPPATALMTATRLPIHARNAKVAMPTTPIGQSPNVAQPYPFSMSVPSSSSSSYSPLPQAPGGFYSGLSPSTTTSFASMSMSGQSSPNTLFSPSASTPSMGQQEAGGSSTNWPPHDGVLVMDTENRSKQQIGKTDRTSSQGPQSNQNPAAVVSLQSMSHKPSKRRKSEPEPEEYRDLKALPAGQVGLGVLIDESSWQGSASTSGLAAPTTNRPRYRRTHSEGATKPLSALATDPVPRTKSSTPPPLSALGSGYFSPGEPTQAGAFFATTVTVALSLSGLGATLEARLGLDEAGLQEIKDDLAGVFDRWRISKGLRAVSLSGPSGSAQMESSGSTMTAVTALGVDDLEMRDDSVINTNTGSINIAESPIRPHTAHVDSSFFTPAPMRTTRTEINVPQTMPNFAVPQMSNSQYLQPHESPLAQQRSTSSHGSQSSQHVRTRSLSSASMAARGLIISSAAAQTPPRPPAMLGQPPLRWTRNPGLQDIVIHGHGSGSEGPSTSPTLQTPSTGEGSFPSAESIGMVAAMNYQAQGQAPSGDGPMLHAQRLPESWQITGDPHRARTFMTHQEGMDQTVNLPRTGMDLGMLPGQVDMGSSHSTDLHVEMIRGGGGSEGSSTTDTSTTGADWGSKTSGPLDSPLTIASMSRSGSSHMAAPVPLSSMPRMYQSQQHGPSSQPRQPDYSQRHSPTPFAYHPPPGPSFVPLSEPIMDPSYSTPQSQRTIRQAVPFTPPTPVTIRSQALGPMLSDHSNMQQAHGMQGGPMYIPQGHYETDNHRMNDSHTQQSSQHHHNEDQRMN
ncbi:hypothetical protein BD324DRAFT_178308 [Kockovaella imperatae]|uniref:Uncharacterized protein n=1 Tax=Kockovaella imperatae TaxID=4999 RepID=A0A1Y1U8F8_9TREE|nr:hypothetical protein BD324DRAFT_178308 [Kockovaella imperatae]ORX34298.1 hypothetical protein BD324DRAFT_178308 [Kockovaella imperatae]